MSFLTPAERVELDEYERIILFSQQVISGTHPRAKISNRRVNTGALKPPPTGPASFTQSLHKNNNVPPQTPTQPAAFRPLPTTLARTPALWSTKPPPPTEVSSTVKPSNTLAESGHTTSKPPQSCIEASSTPFKASTKASEPATLIRVMTSYATGSFDNEQASFVEIDIKHDYYADLGLDSNASSNSIKRKFQEKVDLLSPSSTEGKSRWLSIDADVRKQTQDSWYRAQKAHKVLSDPVVHEMYRKLFLPAGNGKLEKEVVKREAEKVTSRRKTSAKKLESTKAKPSSSVSHTLKSRKAVTKPGNRGKENYHDSDRNKARGASARRSRRNEREDRRNEDGHGRR